jgi:hypothetical protein
MGLYQRLPPATLQVLHLLLVLELPAVPMLLLPPLQHQKQ